MKKTGFGGVTTIFIDELLPKLRDLETSEWTMGLFDDGEKITDTLEGIVDTTVGNIEADDTTILLTASILFATYTTYTAQ